MGGGPVLKVDEELGTKLLEASLEVVYGGGFPGIDSESCNKEGGTRRCRLVVDTRWCSQPETDSLVPPRSVVLP